MKQNNYSDVKENVIWSMVILLCLGNVFLSISYLYILLFWSISFISVNNVKRLLKYKEVTLVLFRRSVYIIPLLFPLIFFKIEIGEWRWVYALLGGVIGSIFIIPNISDLKLFLDSEYICLFPKEKKSFYLMEIYSSFMGAIGEELFYRGFLISILKYQGVICILISAFMFFLHHYRCKWSGAFSKRDFITQVLFGLVSATLYYFTESIYISVIMHITFNFMDIILNIKKLIVFYILKFDK